TSVSRPAVTLFAAAFSACVLAIIPSPSCWVRQEDFALSASRRRWLRRDGCFHRQRAGPKKRPLKPEGYSRPKAQGPAGARWARTGLSVDGPEKMGCWSRCARHSPRLRDRAAADRSAAGEASKSSV